MRRNPLNLAKGCFFSPFCLFEIFLFYFLSLLVSYSFISILFTYNFKANLCGRLASAGCACSKEASLEPLGHSLR